ncbi:MAG TPA: tripartite tricarboxylate transporter substrate binding protein [Xanthobacteraceae bacterium]
MRSTRVTFALALTATLATSNASAQTYPTRPVTFVAPYAAGGGIDLLARLLAHRLEQRFGRPFVVEDKPGSATVIAASAVARATPDGHTIMLATSTTMAINVSMYPNLSYDPTRDLVPVAQVAVSPFVLVVNPALPIRSVGELVDYAKRHPGELNYGSTGIGSFHHLSAELLSSLTGIKMTHIPYKATPPALNDAVAGHIDLLFGDVTSTLPLIAAGRLRALGVSTAQRLASAPEIPPLTEVGIPGFDSSSWQMVVAPAATPAPIVALLNQALHDILGEPDIRAELGRRGLIPVATEPPEKLKQFVKDEIVRWGAIVHQAGAAGGEPGAQ